MATRNLTTEQAVDYLREEHGIDFAPKTLTIWRSQKRGPRFRKVARKVFYQEDWLDAFAGGQVVETVDSYDQ